MIKCVPVNNIFGFPLNECGDNYCIRPDLWNDWNDWRDYHAKECGNRQDCREHIYTPEDEFLAFARQVITSYEKMRPD